MKPKIIILDFSSRSKQMIGEAIEKAGGIPEVVEYNISLAEVKEKNPDGIIISGSPDTIYDDGRRADMDVINCGLPILGICYGHQMLNHLQGGQTVKATVSEHGVVEATLGDSILFEGLPKRQHVYMTHNDEVVKLADGFVLTGSTPDCHYAACENLEKKMFGVQFHPECEGNDCGIEIFVNFINFCKKGQQKMEMRSESMQRITNQQLAEQFIEEQVKQIKEQVKDNKVLLALSGGVDSSVVAALLIKAIGNQLTCVHVNHGLLRKGEPEQVIEVFRNQMNANLIYVDATDRFLDQLKDVDDPETKRKIIGKVFIDVFAEEARKLEDVKFLAQGTIYPDILESKGVKAHHNVGGLPEDLNFELVEPVKFLYKDEVRVVGKALGLPDNMVYRQPFPGPGLGVRCTGAITRDRLESLREADAIVREEIGKLEKKPWQYFAVIPDVQSTGIKDGKRYMGWPVIIRAIDTVDAVTAQSVILQTETLITIRDRIINEVPGVNRVLWDYSDKPVSTIEWE